MLAILMLGWRLDVGYVMLELVDSLTASPRFGKRHAAAIFPREQISTAFSYLPFSYFP
jgi:hypothetical protein